MTDGLDQYHQYFTRPVAEVRADLAVYESLLRKWQVAQNLVSRETLGQIWSRHFADSLQILPLLRQGDRSVLDLGSGGGFPALPLAIALKGGGQSFVLMEPNNRKVSFLRTVARELGLAVKVDARRIEARDSRETVPPDVITSRALASLVQLCGWMAPQFGPETRAILHKGREHVEELAEAATLYDFDVLINNSDTDAQGVLLTISNLKAKSVS